MLRYGDICFFFHMSHGRGRFADGIIPAAHFSCRHGAEHGGTQGRGLVGFSDENFSFTDIGIDLHHHGILLCDPAAGIKLLYRDAKRFKVFDKHPLAEGRGFDECPVNFLRLCLKRQP